MTGRGSTSARGLGWSHQKIRAQLLEALIDGTPCDYCGKPMYRGQNLDADHTGPRSKGGTRADRLLHSSCNRSRKDGAASRVPKRWVL